MSTGLHLCIIDMVNDKEQRIVRFYVDIERKTDETGSKSSITVDYYWQNNGSNGRGLGQAMIVEQRAFPRADEERGSREHC